MRPLLSGPHFLSCIYYLSVKEGVFLVLFLLPYDDVLELVCRSDFSSALVYEGDMDVLANVLCERNRVDSIESP